MPRQNTPPGNYPQAVLQQIQQLGRHIALARKRRDETQAQWAGRLGVSLPTMARIERGDPSVAMASYVMCLWLVNQAQGLADLIAPQHDQVALAREIGEVQARARVAAGRRSRSVAAATGGGHANVNAQGLAALMAGGPAGPEA